MSIYSLKTSLNNGIAGLACAIVNNKKICEWLQDNISEVAEVQEFSEPSQIEDPELFNILKSRLDRLNRARSSGLLSVGDPDYLFSEFLERGLRCSDAVCLLERGFPVEELIDKIKDRPTKDFPEILRRLSRKLDLRSEKEPGGSSDRWVDLKNPDKKVSEALENPDVKNALDDLRKRISVQTDEEEKRRESTIDIPFATGFLVGKNYLMTNFHVLNDQDKEEIKNFTAKFRYERAASGREAAPIEYQLNPDICISDKELDFTIVGVQAKEDYENHGLKFSEAGENFGWLPILADPTLVAPPIKRRQIPRRETEIRDQISRTGLTGEPVFIIQHPRGNLKRIALFNNAIQEMYQSFFKYETDTDFGSSGSPVLNQRWQLVGLHHSTIAKLAINEEPEIQGNLGTRMCAIVDFLEKNNDNSVAQALLANERHVVQPGGTPIKGTINVLVGHQRQDAPSLDHAAQEIDIAKFLLEKILENSEQSFPVKNVLELAGTYEDGLDYLSSGQGYQEYESGDVAVDIRTNFYSDNSQPTNITIYYTGTRPELKAYADIVLSKIRGELGRIEPIQTGSDPSLKFFDVVKMPALVISFDFYGMDSDQVKGEIAPPIHIQREALWRTIDNALKDLVRVVSPIGFWSND